MPEPLRRPLQVAALVKQIPAFETMELTPDGRLRREGLPLEMSAYDRRAVAEGVALARQSGGRCTVITLGPPPAEDVLRESVAFGADAGVLITDPQLAGSDTLVTARALAAALERLGPFDLVLVGRNSVDAETGQVGPQVAQLLDLPFATGVKQLEVDDDGGTLRVGCELDDGWADLTVALPAVLSTAERLIDPVKIKDPAVWAAVDPARISRLDAAALGPGPWGAASPTWVGEVRVAPDDRLRRRLEGPLADQLAIVVEALVAAGVHDDGAAVEPQRSGPVVPRAGGPVVPRAGGPVVPRAGGPVVPQAGGPVVAVLVEPGRQRLARELLGAAADLAAELGGRVVAVGPWLLEPEPVSAAVVEVLASWGADAVVVLAAEVPGTAPLVEEDVARAVADWIGATEPVVVLGPSTAWGREVAGRVTAARGLGLTGDAIALELDPGDDLERRLVAWKPAFGGAMVAAVRSRSATQVVTVRPGVVAPPEPRTLTTSIETTTLAVSPRARVEVRARRRDDDLEVLATARRVVSVGKGVDPSEYPALDGLLAVLGADLAATRKVTDEGWLPHSRQVDITGLSLAPDVAIVVGASGKFNHMVGLRRAGLIVAVNPDPTAPVFDAADYGIVADWHIVVPELERLLTVASPRGGLGG